MDSRDKATLEKKFYSIAIFLAFSLFLFIPSLSEAEGLIQTSQIELKRMPLPPLHAPTGVSPVHFEQAARSSNLPSSHLAQPESDTIVLNFIDANLIDIIRYIGEITSDNFIISPGISGRISIQTAKPVLKKDVFGIFESILELNGLSAVKAGSYYKIVTAPSAKQRSREIRNGSEAGLPEGDSVMTQILPVEFISSNDLVSVLQPMISATGNIANYQKGNTLIITDTGSNIKKLLEITASIDIDGFSRMHITLVPVENVDIKTIHKELKDILIAVGLGKDSGQFSIVPIERLNSFMVFAVNERLIDSLREWVQRLDQSNSTGISTNIYYVQNDKASNIKSILDQIFSGRQYASADSSSGAGSGVYSKNESANISIYLYEPTNALIVQASQADYQRILKTIKELDAQPKQVMIEALIAEVKLDETTKFGIQWSALTGNANIQLNTGILSSTINNPAGAISAPIGASAPTGLSIFATDASKFFGAIQALASDGKIDVLSNPHIVVKNYEKASINVGSDEPIATQSTQTAVTGTTGIIQNIEYRKTGVILTVTPHITEGGMVAMSIRQEVSDKSTDRTVGSAVYPSFSKREAETSVVAKNGETLVIGGLIQDRKDNTSSGVPLLSKIPLLGNLFKFSTYSVGKTELIILITPKIMGNSKQALSVTDEVKAKLKGLGSLLNID